MDYSGECDSRLPVAPGFGGFLVVRLQLRVLYGTLGAAIGLMTWLWISINIVLVGGEINSQLEERVEPEKAKAQP